MAYLGEYIEVGWENEPSQRTPVNAYNLGIMEDGIKRLFAYLIAGGGSGSGGGSGGREVELRNNGEYIQWRYSGEEDWTNLVALADLKGEKGDDYVLTNEDIEEIASKVKVATSADKITYDDSQTQLGATNVQEAIGKVSEQIGDLKENGTTGGTGLSAEAIDKLEEVGNYLVYTTADGGSKWTELIAILRSGSSGEETEVTLSSISATYSGGSVLVGTSVNALTGIVVTAKYSDGSTKTVTGYTLSGTIAEGSNTVTISYGGKSTTITVIGYAEDEPEVTLSSITVTYTGGDVAVGTALTDLTGITVTGHYSDGSTSEITGYTLSGEIMEGSNTITVSYSGLTTTFTVTGIAESGGDGENIVPVTWTYGYKFIGSEPVENASSCYSSVIDTTGHSTLTIRIKDGANVTGYSNVIISYGDAEQTAASNFTQLSGYFGSNYNKEMSIETAKLSTNYVWITVNNSGYSSNINNEKVEVILL